MSKTEKDRRTRIIQSAIELFEEKGVAFTRLSEVAKNAKVPAPLIHYYYADIEDLHFDVIHAVFESLKEHNIGEAVKHADDPVRMLREYLKGPLLWAVKYPGHLSIWLYFYYMASWSEKFEDLSTRIREGGRERIALMIFRGLEKKVFHNPENRSVSELAHLIQSQMTGQFVMYGCEKKSRPIETYIRELEQSIFQILRVQLPAEKNRK